MRVINAVALVGALGAVELFAVRAGMGSLKHNGLRCHRLGEGVRHRGPGSAFVTAHPLVCSQLSGECACKNSLEFSSYLTRSEWRTNFGTSSVQR